MKPVSDARRKRDRHYGRQRDRAYARADGRCEAGVLPVCIGTGQQVHHIAGRGGGDPHRLENLLLVCLPCHRWIEDNRAEATERGLLRSRLRKVRPSRLTKEEQ